MADNKRVRYLFGWLLTILLQAAAAVLLIIAISSLVAALRLDTRYILFVDFLLWLSHVLGINLVGWLAFRWVWKDIQPKTRQRLIGSGIGALIGWLLLLFIGDLVPVEAVGTPTYHLLTYVILLVLVLGGLVGYYLPGLKPRTGKRR